MADTIRTKAELLNIFADNQAAGSIIAGDVRDLTVSVPNIVTDDYPTTGAQLQSFVAQTAVATNTVYTVDLTTQHHIENITHNIAVDADEVTIIEDGLYEIMVGANFYKTGGGTESIAVFLQEELASNPGVWVTTSAAVRRDIADNNVAGFASLGHIDRHVAGDKYRVAWVTTSTDAILQTFAAGDPESNFPAIPSVDFRIQKVGIL